jgi:hypothetical protein
MNEFTFKTGMGLMQKLFGHKLDIEIYSFYWNALKELTDQEWKGTMDGIINNFVPSSQVPFPPIAIFQKHRPQSLIESAPQYGIEYKPFVPQCPEDEPMTPEEIENFINSLPPIFRSLRFKRGGDLERLGDVINTNGGKNCE